MTEDLVEDGESAWQKDEGLDHGCREGWADIV